MGNLIRTTILLPEEIHERLKLLAVRNKTTVSDILRESLDETIFQKKEKAGIGIKKLLGKYSVKGKKSEFVRSKFYDDYLRKEMSY